MTTSRAGLSEYVTMCLTCHQEVGVWMTTFNAVGMEANYKTAAHGRPRCPGSLLSISKNVAFPNPNRKRRRGAVKSNA